VWRTQTGERILSGAEARLIRTALGVLVDQVEEEIQGFRESLDFGVPLFDRLQDRQKLALLAEVGDHLLRSTGAPPPLTATNESAVAVRYRVIEEWVAMEVDDEEAIREMQNGDLFAWRRKVRAAFRESCPDDLKIPPESCRKIEEWSLLIECLEGRVLWDADFLDEDLYADQAPEVGQLLKNQMNVSDEYFTAVAPDPSDHDLEVVRRTIRALIDG
jgi:hypothetical protein